jgi:acetoin utilization protein AcuB
MQGHRVRGLPVVEGEELIGIITDRDIRNHLLSLDSTTVRQAMTLSPVTVTPSTSVKEAAQLLDRHKVGALPVLADGHLVGIVSTSDLLKALIEW